MTHHAFHFVFSRNVLALSICAALGLNGQYSHAQTLLQQVAAQTTQTSTPIATAETRTLVAQSPSQPQTASVPVNQSPRSFATYSPINLEAVSIQSAAAPLSYTPLSTLTTLMTARTDATSQHHKRESTSPRSAFGQANANGGTPGNVMVTPGSKLVVQLPEHIPVSCVTEAAQRYQVPEMALISIIRQESGGRHVIGSNNNGSRDYGPAQINDRTWGEYLQKNYNITLGDVLNNMCQAIMVEAYILRLEWNSCISRGNPDIWCAIAHYHSPDPAHQKKYVSAVWQQHQYIVARGRF